MNALQSTPRPRARLSLLALFGANAISMVGNVLAMVAIPWFVLQTTGSAAKTGIAAFFTVLATILGAFFGGALVDRLDYKRVSTLTDLASGVTVALIPFFFTMSGLTFWQLLVLVFLGALFDAPGASARKAMLPDLATQAGMKLERANATMLAIERGASLIGAPLAGVLIAFMGATTILWIDAASFALSATLVSLAIPARPRQTPEQASAYIDDLSAGLRLIWSDRLVRTIVLTVLITNFLDAPLFSVMMPVYADWVLDSAEGLGLIIAAWGSGSLVGALLFSAIGHKVSRRMLFVGAFLFVGLPFWILAMLPPLPGAMGALALMGLVAAPLNPIISTVVQERVPSTMRGRVIGAIAAVAYIAIPLGTLLAGYLLELIGLRATLLLQATAYLVVTASLFYSSTFHEMNTPAVEKDTMQLRTENS
jgi:MFS family permease